MRETQAFELLYEQFKLPLWRRLWYLIGDPEIARDLHQETFFRVWTKLPEKHDNAPFEAWFYAIARNLAIDYLRHERLLTFCPLPEPEHGQSRADYSALAGQPGPAEYDDYICERECIRLALAEMSEHYRVCVLLQDLWGYSRREIAQMLEISEKTVSSNVSRGHQQLRNAYRSMISDGPLAKKEGEQRT